MADKKISELTALTGANVATDDQLVIVDTSAALTKNITIDEFKNALDTATGFVRITGDTMTGNLSMGDNVKAIFGAGSDLWIYSDGTDSYIEERNGTGSLYIDATDLQLRSTANAKYFRGITGGAVDLYYDNASKLATTSTGIDVTGTVTADGLTVDGVATLNRTNPILLLNETDTTNLNVGLNVSASTFNIGKYADAGNKVNDILSIDVSTGDISFYEDTGTTAKFFWDASAESLGIGTSSPSTKLELASNDATNSGLTNLLTLSHTTTGTAGDGIGTRIVFEAEDDGGTASTMGYIDTLFTDVSDGAEKSAFAFSTRNGGSIAERMRIDSSGNVGIDFTPKTMTANVTSSLNVGSGTVFQRTKDTYLGSNMYYNASDVGKSISTGYGLAYYQDVTNGAHKWFTSAVSAGSADATHSFSTPMIIDSSGNVGIGTSSPNSYSSQTTLTINGSTYGRLDLESAGTLRASLFATTGSTTLSAATDVLSFDTSGGEAMRINSSGNLLVGTTDGNPTGNHEPGTVIAEYGQINVHRDGGNPLRVGSSVDGNLTEYYKQGELVGSIGANGGDIYIGNSDVTLSFNDVADLIAPTGTDGSTRDGVIDLGNGGNRFDDIFATNGTIQTSDRNEKQDIAELSDAEQRVAVAAKGLLRKFRWKSAVEEKGDEARTHFGIIAQDLQAAFAAEGLDAGDYAMFISSTWTDEETGEERTRMGVRYSELLAFIIAAI
jgi:hypothetical protein